MVVLSREQRTGLDLSGSRVQVHGGRRGDARPVFALHPRAHQVRHAAIYQDADILRREEGGGEAWRERGGGRLITGALIQK